MSLVENAGAFLPDCSQRIDREEAPVVDLLGSDAPVGWSIGLGIEQRFQSVERCWLRRITVERLDGLFDREPDRFNFFGQRFQTVLGDNLLSSPLLDKNRVCFVVGGTEASSDKGRSNNRRWCIS